MDDRSWTDGCPDKGHQVVIIATINLSNPNSPKACGTQYFHSHGHHHLGGVALAPNGTDGVLPISECKVGLIDFDLPIEQLPIRADHCSA